MELVSEFQFNPKGQNGTPQGCTSLMRLVVYPSGRSPDDTRGAVQSSRVDIGVQFGIQKIKSGKIEQGLSHSFAMTPEVTTLSEVDTRCVTHASAEAVIARFNAGELVARPGC